MSRALTLTALLALFAWQGPSVSLSGPRLAIDGTPTFLLGISCFDALGTRSPDDADLDQIRAWGLRVVRVWAHWRTPIYGRDGTLTVEGRQRLMRIVERLGSRGLILELVLLRPGQLSGQRFGLFSTADARVTAVRAIADVLKPHRHVIFDLYNEHDHPDGPIDHAEARRLRDAVKAIDSERIVTLSSTEYHFLDQAGELSDRGRRALVEEVEMVRVDVLAPHFPRTPDWAARTESRVTALRAAVGRTSLPIYLNEEQRARETTPASADYVRAADGARRAGAAAWLFHTDAGYDLTKQSIRAALRAAEREAVGRIGR